MRLSLLMSAILVASPAFAQQQETQREAPQRGVGVDVGRDGVQVDVATGGQEDRALRTERVSQLTGVTAPRVRNEAGEDIGNVHDLVVDLESGEIKYAAVSVGGFLGIGDQMFAVPYDAIDFRAETRTGIPGQWVAIWDVDREALRNMRGFDQQNWPDMADRRWREENEGQFRALDQQRQERQTQTPREGQPLPR